MQLNQDLCIGCGLCLPWCPVEAIYIEDGKANIDHEVCTECGTCARPGVFECPMGCFTPETVEWPRSVRQFFSDPMATHAETKIPGRGTEEAKTNDVTGRVKRGEVGIGIEMGRPAVGVWGRDIDRMTRALAAAGIEFERNNPLTYLMADPARGILKEEVLGCHLISAIVEFTIPRTELKRILKVALAVAEEIGTVFSLDLATRFDGSGQLPEFPELAELGLEIRPNAKINVGLGRPLFREETTE